MSNLVIDNLFPLPKCLLLHQQYTEMHYYNAWMCLMQMIDPCDIWAVSRMNLTNWPGHLLLKLIAFGFTGQLMTWLHSPLDVELSQQCTMNCLEPKAEASTAQLYTTSSVGNEGGKRRKRVQMKQGSKAWGRMADLSWLVNQSLAIKSELNWTLTGSDRWELNFSSPVLIDSTSHQLQSLKTLWNYEVDCDWCWPVRVGVDHELKVTGSKLVTTLG